MTAKVYYQIATYSGYELVYNVDPDNDNDQIISRAKKQLTQKAGFLPYGSQSFRVEREE
jgi:hypothetical protein